MATSIAELRKRSQVESAYEAGFAKSVETADQIRQAALAEFQRQLDAKLKNLQIDESLAIQFRFDIIGRDGKVRGGSGSQRNMPEYIAWRSAVYERDHWTCQECGSVKRLNAHHVKGWAGHPELRFDVDNGVTLCFDCHAEKHPHLRFMKHGEMDEVDT